MSNDEVTFRDKFIWHKMHGQALSCMIGAAEQALAIEDQYEDAHPPRQTALAVLKWADAEPLYGEQIALAAQWESRVRGQPLTRDDQWRRHWARLACTLAARLAAILNEA